MTKKRNVIKELDDMLGNGEFDNIKSAAQSIFQGYVKIKRKAFIKKCITRTLFVLVVIGVWMVYSYFQMLEYNSRNPVTPATYGQALFTKLVIL